MVDDRSLLGQIFHSFLGEGGPNEIGGQILQGSLFTRPDLSACNAQAGPFAGEDTEAGVSPAVEHADKFPGDFLLAQEHGEHLQAEELLPVFEFECRGDPEDPFTVEAPIGQHMHVGVSFFIDSYPGTTHMNYEQQDH